MKLNITVEDEGLTNDILSNKNNDEFEICDSNEISEANQHEPTCIESHMNVSISDESVRSNNSDVITNECTNRYLLR